MLILIITGVGGTKPQKNFVLQNKKNVTKLAKTTRASKENENPSNNIQVQLFNYYLRIHLLLIISFKPS